MSGEKRFFIKGATLVQWMARLGATPQAGTGFEVVSTKEGEVWTRERFTPPCCLANNGEGLVISPFVVTVQDGTPAELIPITPTVDSTPVSAIPRPTIVAPGISGQVYLRLGDDNDAEIVAAASRDDLDEGAQLFPLGGYLKEGVAAIPSWSWDGNVHLSRVDTMTFEVLFDLFSLTFISNEDTGSRTEYRNIDDDSVGLVTLSWDPDAGLWRLIYEGEPYTAVRTITDPGGEYNYIGNTDPPPLDPLRLDPAN